MNNPLVSVVITTYNQEKYISQAVESVLCQKTDFPFEIIICDDHSTDGTGDIVRGCAEKHPDIITLYTREENLGISENWYRGLMSARGDYITTLEGDDYWTDENKLQKQVDFLKKNPEYAGVSCERKMVDDDGREYEFFTTSYGTAGKKNTVKTFLSGKTFSYTACLHVNFFKDSGGIYHDFITSNRSIADFSLCMLLLDRGPVYVLEDKMAVYRIAGDTGRQQNYSSRNSAVKKYADSLRVINNTAEYFGGKYSFNRCLSVWSFIPFVECLKGGQVKSFLKEMGGLPLPAKLWCAATWTGYIFRVAGYKLHK